jgi:hypothetical protein
MLDGVGRSMNEWLIIFINGCVFRMFVIRGFRSLITTMIFHVISLGLSPCGNYDLFYVLIKYYVCVGVRGFFF